MTNEAAQRLRETRPLKMSPFEEAGARLRNDKWDAQEEPPASEPGADVDYMTRYDRRILLVELDALRAALAFERKATVERIRAAVGPEYDDDHVCQYRLHLAGVRAILDAELSASPETDSQAER